MLTTRYTYTAIFVLRAMLYDTVVLYLQRSTLGCRFVVLHVLPPCLLLALLLGHLAWQALPTAPHVCSSSRAMGMNETIRGMRG